MPSKAIPFRIEEDLLARVDAAARALGMTRSAWWKQAARAALNLTSALPSAARSDLDPPPPVFAPEEALLLALEAQHPETTPPAASPRVTPNRSPKCPATCHEPQAFRFGRWVCPKHD